MRLFVPLSVAPEITVSQQLHGVGPGANVTIECSVEAHPTAINYWMKDREEMLLNGPKYKIREEIVNEYQRIMHLTVTNWQEVDESHFTCISTNSLGKADGKIQAYSKRFVMYCTFMNTVYRHIILLGISRRQQKSFSILKPTFELVLHEIKGQNHHMHGQISDSHTA